LLFNCRSLFPKLDELKLLCLTLSPLFIFCNETWLHSAISDELVTLSQYNLLRADRKNKRGGGLCVYYKETIQLNAIKFAGISENVECLCFIYNKIIYVLCYFPPWLKAHEVSDAFDSLIFNIDTIKTHHPSTQTFIVGDFNRTPTHILCNNLNLVNIVKENTRLNAILDCCFISSEIATDFNANVGPPLSKSDHKSVYIYSETSFSKSQKQYHHIYDYRESNLLAFNNEVEKINWSTLLELDDIDKKSELFSALNSRSSQANPHNYSCNDWKRQKVVNASMQILDQQKMGRFSPTRL